MFFKKKNNESRKRSPKEKRAEFWGASDGIVCCKGISCEVDEFNATSNPKLQNGGYVCTLEITAPDQEQGLYIHCFYSGHWSFAVSPSTEESDELPDWHIERSWGAINAHSETLVVYCPNGSKVDAIERIEACS